MIPASVNTRPRISSSTGGSAPPAVVETTPESSSDFVASEDSSLEPSFVEQKSGANAHDSSGKKSCSCGPLQGDISSRREQIRAKLRASETKLRSFASAASEDLNHIATVQADLKKLESEKSQLEVELNKLKHEADTEGDDFLQEQMVGIQRGFEAQVHKIQSLQAELQSREDEIECLHEELVRKIRRIVELEFDLETHEVHYTNYAAEQFKLGEEALSEIKEMRAIERRSSCSGNMNSGSMSPVKNKAKLGSSTSSLTGTTGDDTTSACSSRIAAASLTAPRKTQQLITKLLSDLDDLEERYKTDKLESATELQQVHLLNDQLRTRIEVLETEVSKLAKSPAGTISSSDAAAAAAAAASKSIMIPSHETNQFLLKRVKTLEARRALAVKNMERVQAEFRALKKTYMSEKEDNKMMFTGLQTENDALRARIAQLESLSSAAASNPEKKKRSKTTLPSTQHREFPCSIAAYLTILQNGGAHEINHKKLPRTSLLEYAVYLVTSLSKYAMYLV